MSFNDLERGLPSGGTGRGKRVSEELALAAGDDKRFTALAERVSLQIFRINSNTAGIESLVKQLGSKHDNAALRTKLSNLTEATKELVKSSTDDLRQLASYEITEEDAASRQRKLKQAKTARDFQSAILSYQNAAKASADKQRQYVERAKAAIDHGDAAGAGLVLSPSESSPILPQQQQQQLVHTELIPDSELEYQEQVIQEREGEIREIESGILELNEIFRDLGTIVTEQQSMLDNIERNVISVANDTQNASEELVSAHNYQRKAGRRMLCLMLIFIFVLAIVLLAVLS